MIGAFVVMGSEPQLVWAGEPEALLVCAPCSRSFLPAAEQVVRELGLENQVTVTPSSCLGPCNQGNVIAFRGEVYRAMDPEKLRTFLQATYSLP